MILIGFPKAEVDPVVLEEVKLGKAGSIILFEKNVPAKNSYHELEKMIWTYKKAAPIPLLVAIDQEGGKVNRLKEKYSLPRSVTAAAMGKDASLDSVRFYGASIASTLSGLGININFAPVVDLASNPYNPIIAKVERAFSANEDTVYLMAREYIKEHHKRQVLTVLKHFPGHGSSKDDTHLGLADVTATWEKRELVPYQKLINEQYVDAVMTAHIVNKNLDDRGLPGTLSDRMINQLLRNDLGFDGVVFSDDMQMHAITKHYGFEEAIKLAILAGVDILCFSNNIQGSDLRTVDRVHSIIKNYVSQGVISQHRIDESFKRILELKKRHSQTQEEIYRLELVKIKKQGVELERRAREEVEQAIKKAEQLNEEKNQDESSSKKSKTKKKKKENN
ncbi:MAG: glycoside hydrolase family 3 protein [Flammeovirgaceae bacterium]|nr:glycoside hydrolase family 3 protein [Flammeovirgaceae bacterium]